MSASTAKATTDRRRYIVDVFETAYGEQMRSQSKAWRGKFRKLASGAFPFYRGSAVVFYSDLADDNDPFVNEQSSRIWIQGDLHAENFGSYLDSTGRLVFDVNDFDEAYVGPYTWDVRRLAASLALIGYDKAMADEEIRELITAFVQSYAAQVKRFAERQDDSTFALTLENTEGVLLDVLRSARQLTRVGLLDGLTEIKDADRRFVRNHMNSNITDEARAALEKSFAQYLETIPAHKRQSDINYRIKDATATQGFGIGSAGLRMFSLLLEGPTQTLENDIIVAFKQSRPSAVTCAVKDQHIKDYFIHDGFRAAISRRALQAHADPLLGYSEFDGAGMLVTEISPYGASPEWSDINDLEEMHALVKDLGRATAKIHCVSDEDSDRTLVKGSADAAILSSFAGREAEFTKAVTEWSENYALQAREDHRLFVDAFRNREFPSLRD